MTSLRSWIAVALLAGSWMFGLGYFYPPDYADWVGLSAVAAILLYGTPVRLPEKRDLWLAVILLVPTAIWTPWPYAIVPIFLLAGLLLQLTPRSLLWTRALGRGIVAAGGILLVQALALAVYTAQTARSHELPWPLADFLAAAARWFSIDAAFDGVNIVFRTMRETHRLAPAWELLVDPVSMGFLFGGMLLLGSKIAASSLQGNRWRQWIAGAGILAVIMLVWLPLRAVLLIAIYVHRVLGADPDRTLYVMNHFFAPWPMLLLSLVPILLAWRFVQIKTGKIQGEGEAPAEPSETVDVASPTTTRRDSRSPDGSRYFAALLLTAAAAAILTAAVEWTPVGKRKEGRVKFVERHSTWEPIDKAYDTSWYGEPAGYNYRVHYDYLGQFYEMGRIGTDEKIDDAALDACDVLVIKTPTERYSKEEVEAVVKFVLRGGGVLFIGDHTNLDGMATTMNDMSRPMGFIYRDDLLFSNEQTKIRTRESEKPEPIRDKDPNYQAQDEPVSPDEKTCYHQYFAPPWPAHPALSHMPPMDFAVSCSIDPGSSSGRPAILSTGLWSMPPDYHMENYHPLPQHCAAMRYGAFVQLWATYYGRGRAMAFTDSTIFSNFCAYQPGHTELLLGMVEWLNHDNPPLDPRPWLSLLGTVVLAAAGWLTHRGGYREGTGVCFLAAGMAAWIGTCGLVAAAHRASMTMPPAIKPLPRIVIDRTSSEATLSQGAWRKGENGTGFGLMEQWIPRLGCTTVRLEGEASFVGDAVVTICPTRTVSKAFSKNLVDYVKRGGKLLVFDDPENRESTANELLSLFGIAVTKERAHQGSLMMKGEWPNIPVENACEISGGEAIAHIDGQPVAAVARKGKGLVMAIGFGTLFNDRNFGYNWIDENPKKPIKEHFNVFYALFRSFLQDKPIKPTREAFGETGEPDDRSKPGEIPLPPNEPEEKPKPVVNLPDLPGAELGPKE